MFKALTKSTLSEYINYVRILHAEQLLLNTDKLVLEICEETGFSSVSYFAKVFKEKNGITPKTIIKAIDTSLGKAISKKSKDYSITDETVKSVAEESQVKYKSEKDIKKAILEAKKEMEKAVKNLDFMEAAKYRDIIIALEERMNQ